MSSHLLNGAEAAGLLFDRFLSISTSPSYLFLLKLRCSTIMDTDFGGGLLELCDELCIDVTRLNPAFFAEVERRIALQGSGRYDFLHNVCVCEKKKKDCVRKYYEKVHAARLASANRDKFNLLGAYMPFSFQIMGSFYSLREDREVIVACFFMFSSPEEGMRKIVQLYQKGYAHTSTSGETNTYPQIIEQRFGGRAGNFAAMDNRLSYLIVDWEVLGSKVGGRLTHDQLQERMREAPLWFYRQILALGYVDPAVKVRVLLKNKSRWVRDEEGNPDYKHSAHLVFNLAGLTTELAALCRAMSGKFNKRLAVCRNDFSKLDDAELGLPWFAVDWKALGGNTGFSCMLSKKKCNEPFPTLERVYVFQNGELLPDHVPTEPPPTDAEGYYRCIAASLCTTPRLDVAPFTPRLEAYARASPGASAKADQDRTDADRHQAASGSSRSSLPSDEPDRPVSAAVGELPGWVASALVSTRWINTTWARTYFKNIQDLLGAEEMKEWRHIHVKQGFYCPAALCHANPRKVIHDSNAVIVVYHPTDPEFVYCRCTKCFYTDNPHPEATVVKSSSWVRYTEQSLKFLLGAAKK
jgi:hypothetical protein